ncbi:hypothetical protein GSI_04800 [Ganoderma sinense ZZ0214-1]|uniref:Transporter n=1 Tax=Ganoderma sinense ZZ0214-1 TaxID=1077348 RepID=A0A2G8SHV1_9APHY|nr:hypothetical protein GSI_04800 [Ganoderma sinense ZZ0214-1]
MSRLPRYSLLVRCLRLLPVTVLVLASRSRWTSISISRRAHHRRSSSVAANSLSLPYYRSGPRGAAGPPPASSSHTLLLLCSIPPVMVVCARTCAGGRAARASGGAGTLNACSLLVFSLLLRSSTLMTNESPVSWLVDVEVFVCVVECCRGLRSLA